VDANQRAQYGLVFGCVFRRWTNIGGRRSGFTFPSTRSDLCFNELGQNVDANRRPLELLDFGRLVSGRRQIGGDGFFQFFIRWHFNEFRGYMDKNQGPIERLEFRCIIVGWSEVGIGYWRRWYLCLN
jgi:hypothetical protein